MLSPRILLASMLLCACRPVESTPPDMDQPLIDPVAATTELEPGESPNTNPSSRPPATIYRSELDRALRGGPGYLLRQLGPEPFRHGGRFVGWELTRLFPDDRELCAPGCDIVPGDVILAVAGDRLETPQALTKLLERLPELDRLEVVSLRDGKRRTRTYTLVEDRPGR